MPSAREWKEPHLADTNDLHHREAIEALASLLDNKISPTEAAKAITATYETWLAATPASTREPDRNHKISAFWVLYMCDAVRTFGDAAVQERLLDLLVQISKRPDVKNSNGLTEKGPNNNVYWRDLPHWSYAFSEYGLHYADPVDFAPDEADDYYAQAPLLLNATRFGAMMLARGEIKCRLPAAADVFLEMGIEQPYDESMHMAREWEVLLPVAATWLIVAGKRFYELCQRDSGGDDAEGSLSGRKRWDGRAWSPERWALWKKKFHELSSRADITGECRTLANEALRGMADVDAGRNAS